MIRGTRFKATRAVAVATAVGVGVAASAAAPAYAGGSSPGVSGKHVTIGLNLAMSGPYAIFGQTAAGVDAYFKTINAKGGANGYKFTAVTGDNQNQSALATSVARQQAASTFATIGLSDNILPAAGPIAKQVGEPLFAGANGSFFVPASTYLFGLPPDYANIGYFDTEFIYHHLHTKKFAFVYSNDDVGQPIQTTLPKFLRKTGGKLLADIPVDATQTDFSSTAARLKASKAKVVLAWADAIAFPQIQKAAAAIGYHPKWVTLFDKFTPSYTSVAGSLAQGVYADNWQIPLSTKSPAVSAYVSAMKKDSPANVTSTFAQQGWTFAAIIADGVEQATKGGKPLTRAAFAQAMDHLPSAGVGLLPSLAFNGHAHYATDQSGMFEYKGSSWTQVESFTQLPTLAKP